MHPANLLSLSRPAIGIYGLVEFADEPVKLSIAMCCAIATDGLDGIVARKLDIDNPYGAYYDILADRVFELSVMWTYASREMIPAVIPAIFTAKSAIVDPVRFYRDWKKKDFSEPLEYGDNDNRIERYAYAGVKGAYLAGVPILNNISNMILGITTTMYGVYRGIRSLINKKEKN
jgi:phosphatidylglycerophosphate synthase